MQGIFGSRIVLKRQDILGWKGGERYGNHFRFIEGLNKEIFAKDKGGRVVQGMRVAFHRGDWCLLQVGASVSFKLVPKNIVIDWCL